jgi:hypothetical protein
VIGVGAALAFDGSAARGHARSRYGGLPSWLPKPKVAIGRTLTASQAHQVLAIQGETVSVDLPTAHARVTAAGPEVPQEGRSPVPATSPCTFVVSFAAATHAIPLDPAAFKFVDDLGHARQPRVTAMSGAPPPSDVPVGTTVSLRLHDVLPTGDGALTWSPDRGRPIVAWDFSVEID